jgi:hypothetical protein
MDDEEMEYHPLYRIRFVNQVVLLAVGLWNVLVLPVLVIAIVFCLVEKLAPN